MTTKNIKDAVAESVEEFAIDQSWKIVDAEEAQDAIDWLHTTLTQYHQDLLQEIMDDVDLLHKRKELDDNGFCTIRDLLRSKALD